MIVVSPCHRATPASCTVRRRRRTVALNPRHEHEIVKSSSSRLIGYASVSSNGQELKLQLDALIRPVVQRPNIFTDKVSGAKSARPDLERCLEQVNPGDVLTVWRLDRLGRSMRHLLDLVDQLWQRGIGFKSLCDGVIDTTTASGELVFHIFTALAQFERRVEAAAEVCREPIWNWWASVIWQRLRLQVGQVIISDRRKHFNRHRVFQNVRAVRHASGNKPTVASACVVSLRSDREPNSAQVWLLGCMSQQQQFENLPQASVNRRETIGLCWAVNVGLQRRPCDLASVDGKRTATPSRHIPAEHRPPGELT
jgi:hypothetical protein